MYKQAAVALLVLALLLILFSVSCGDSENSVGFVNTIKIVTVDDRVECVIFKTTRGAALDCNWDAVRTLR